MPRTEAWLRGKGLRSQELSAARLPAARSCRTRRRKATPSAGGVEKGCDRGAGADAPRTPSGERGVRPGSARSRARCGMVALRAPLCARRAVSGPCLAEQLARGGAGWGPSTQELRQRAQRTHNAPSANPVSQPCPPRQTAHLEAARSCTSGRRGLFYHAGTRCADADLRSCTSMRDVGLPSRSGSEEQAASLGDGPDHPSVTAGAPEESKLRF